MVFKNIKFKYLWKQVLYCVKLSSVVPLFKPSFEKHLSTGVPPFLGPGLTHPQSPRASSPGGPPHLQAHISQWPCLAGKTRAVAGPGRVAHPSQARVLVQHTAPERCRFSEGRRGILGKEKVSSQMLLLSFVLLFGSIPPLFGQRQIIVLGLANTFM